MNCYQYNGSSDYNSGNGNHVLLKPFLSLLQTTFHVDHLTRLYV